MDWNREALLALRVVIALLLGGFVGWKREWRAREAGMRTSGAVSLAACVCALISTHQPESGAGATSAFRS